MSYDALISSKTLYGNLKTNPDQMVEFVIPRLNRTAFREAVKSLFADLRDKGMVFLEIAIGFAAENFLYESFEHDDSRGKAR